MMSFVDLPVEIHLEIAKAIDPRLCSSPSSQHALDDDYASQVFKDRRLNVTLARLTLVCKRLRHLYTPFSTYRTLFIEANVDHWSGLGPREPSPSLTRVLEYPETGVYAKELLISYQSRSWYISSFDTFTRDNFDRFLANTPRLETVRCFHNAGHVAGNPGVVDFPIQLLESLSSLASLRFLYLDEFYMNSDFELSPSPSLPPLQQVRILRYSPPRGLCMLGYLLLSMPNIHTLYITGNQKWDDEEAIHL
jgi:hypothetical protein